MSENALTIDGGSAAAPALPAVTGASFGNAKGVDALKARFAGFIKQPAVAKSLPLLGLLGTGAWAAYMGGASPWRGALRVTFWGAAAMAAARLIGGLFDVVV